MLAQPIARIIIQLRDIGGAIAGFPHKPRNEDAVQWKNTMVAAVAGVDPTGVRGTKADSGLMVLKAYGIWLTDFMSQMMRVRGFKLVTFHYQMVEKWEKDKNGKKVQIVGEEPVNYCVFEPPTSPSPELHLPRDAQDTLFGWRFNYAAVWANPNLAPDSSDLIRVDTITVAGGKYQELPTDGRPPMLTFDGRTYYAPTNSRRGRRPNGR
jgi:hypothetical protein